MKKCKNIKNVKIKKNEKKKNQIWKISKILKSAKTHPDPFRGKKPQTWKKPQKWSETSKNQKNSKNQNTQKTDLKRCLVRCCLVSSFFGWCCCCPYLFEWCCFPSHALGSGAFLLSSVGWCCLDSFGRCWYTQHDNTCHRAFLMCVGRVSIFLLHPCGNEILTTFSTNVRCAVAAWWWGRWWCWGWENAGINGCAL